MTDTREYVACPECIGTGLQPGAFRMGAWSSRQHSCSWCNGARRIPRKEYELFKHIWEGKYASPKDDLDLGDHGDMPPREEE